MDAENDADVEVLEASITVRESLESVPDEWAFPRLIVALRHAVCRKPQSALTKKTFQDCYAFEKDLGILQAQSGKDSTGC
jgi:hypothetical protein